MATYVEWGKGRILLDPGAVLGPIRYGLPPADEEWEALRRANDRISAYAGRAQVVFVSHYHEDHFRYGPETYAGRRVLAKNPGRMIDPTQGRRASLLWQAIRPRCQLESADGRQWEIDGLHLKASPPLAHGAEGAGLGYLVTLTLTDGAGGFRFVYASDVQGPLSPVATAYLIRERPHLLYLSGPPSYIERHIGTRIIDQGIDNLIRVMEATGCRVILDHYALRDYRYPERLSRLWETGRVVTAAGYLGVPDETLEANRHRLWAGRRRPGTRVEPPRLKPRSASAIVGRRTSILRWKGGKLG